MEGLPVFDIEAVGWTEPIAVGFFDGKIYKEFVRESEEEDILWKFLSYLKENYIGMKLYAHCASKYDNKFILASLIKHGEKINLDSGLIRLKWEGPNISFEDSYLIMPMKLETANKLFGVELKEEWDHEANLKPWDMGEKLPVFKQYMKTDCISLSHALQKLCEVLGTTFGVAPSISLSTTSVKVFDRYFCSLDTIYPNEEFEDFIREATYGGRNEVYKRYGENINLYDVRFMYVSAYDVPIPTTKMNWVKPNLDKGTIAEATVKVPTDWYIGPLPYRLHRQLVFPVGEFTSWWDVRELKNAADLGVDVAIRRELYCEEEPVLKGFGEFMGTLREGPLTDFWKIFGISLSGKLGQLRWRDTVRHISKITSKGDGSSLEGYTPLDRSEEYWQRKEYMGAKAPYIRPMVSMRVRSEARIRHLKFILEACKQGEIFYGDTDSIYARAKLPTGKNVGDLVDIGVAEKGYFIRQKLYAYIREGKLIQRSSGYSDLKLSEEDYKGLLDGKEMEVDSINFPSYRSQLMGEDVYLLDKSRKVSMGLRDSRVPVGLDTEPIKLPLKP